MVIFELFQIQIVDGVSIDDESIEIGIQQLREPTGLAVFGAKMDVADNNRPHWAHPQNPRELWTADV